MRGALVPQRALVLGASFTNGRCSKKSRTCPHLFMENSGFIKMVQIRTCFWKIIDYSKWQMVPHRKHKKSVGSVGWYHSNFWSLDHHLLMANAQKSQGLVHFLFWKCHICQIALDRASGNSKKHASDFKKSGVCWYPSDFMCLKHHLPHIYPQKNQGLVCIHVWKRLNLSKLDR